MERNRVAVLICVFSSYLVSLKILSAANETAAQSVHNSTIDSHGFLFGDSSWLNETESTEEFNSNTSFVLTNLTTTDNTNSEYWDINNQKGVMKRQNLRFRKIGSKGMIFAAHFFVENNFTCAVISAAFHLLSHFLCIT